MHAIIPWLSVVIYSALNCLNSRSKVHRSQAANLVSTFATSSFYLVALVYILQITKGIVTPLVILGFGAANAVGSWMGMEFSLKYLKKFELD
jgi:hypothetical protein